MAASSEGVGESLRLAYVQGHHAVLVPKMLSLPGGFWDLDSPGRPAGHGRGLCHFLRPPGASSRGLPGPTARAARTLQPFGSLAATLLVLALLGDP